MKQLLISLVLTIWFQCPAQDIVAGEFDANEYYLDFVPNELLLAPEPVNWSFDSLYLDLNNDGIDDVILNVHNWDGGNWLRKKHAEIIPKVNSEVSLGEPDTCFANCPPPDYLSIETTAKAFDSSEIINASGNWMNTPAYLAFSKFEANVPNGCGYSCNGGNFDTIFQFVGVRIFNAGDTLYGWIKLNVFETNPGDFDMTVDAFACNTYVLSTAELATKKKELVRIIDNLGRETENQSGTLLIYIYSDGTTKKVFQVD